MTAADGRPSGQPRACVRAAAVVVADLGYLVAFGRRATPEQSPVPVIAASGPPLPSGAIRFIAIDGQVSAWFRVAKPGRRPGLRYGHRPQRIPPRLQEPARGGRAQDL